MKGCIATGVVAILVWFSLFAAGVTMVGGCASRITYASDRKQNASGQGEDKEEERKIFLTEHPIASMLRSFLVYLAFIAGVFITTNDPFGLPTPDQYVRLAGLLSFVSFVIGYDPTRFRTSFP